MKIKIPGCSICKKPYSFEYIKYDSSKNYIELPCCDKDIEHEKGYDDILIEIEIN